MSKDSNIDSERDGQGLRELRLLVPDARLASVRQRVADASAKLAPDRESDAMSWIEAVSDFDATAEDFEN